MIFPRLRLQPLRPVIWRGCSVNQGNRFGAYAWSMNVLAAWIILLFVTIVEAIICVSILDGTLTVVSGNLAITLVTLFFFIPPFVITEEIFQEIYIRNPVIRPLYATTLAYLTIVALIQISYAIFNSNLIALGFLLLGRFVMCLFFQKYPMDSLNV